MNLLTRIETLAPEIIDNFILSGESQAIAPDLQAYIMQLSWAVEIWENEKNVTRAAKALRTRIYASQHIALSLIACKTRLYDALGYFNVDCNVSTKFWLLDAADKYANLEKLAISQDKLTEAGRFMKEGLECRIKANSELSAADLKPPVFLISNKMKLDDLGFEKKSLKDIAKKDNDGYYIKMITALPIDKKQKKMLLIDADISDAEIVEELKND